MKDQFQLSEIQETYLHALLISLHESLLKDFMSLLGDTVTTLKLETIHFDIDINLLGETCTCLKDLYVRKLPVFHLRQT